MKDKTLVDALLSDLIQRIPQANPHEFYSILANAESDGVVTRLVDYPQRIIQGDQQTYISVLKVIDARALNALHRPGIVSLTRRLFCSAPLAHDEELADMMANYKFSYALIAEKQVVTQQADISSGFEETYLIAPGVDIHTRHVWELKFYRKIPNYPTPKPVEEQLQDYATSSCCAREKKQRSVLSRLHLLL